MCSSICNPSTSRLNFDFHLVILPLNAMDKEGEHLEEYTISDDVGHLNLNVASENLLIPHRIETQGDPCPTLDTSRREVPVNRQ